MRNPPFNFNVSLLIELQKSFAHSGAIPAPHSARVVSLAEEPVQFHCIKGDSASQHSIEPCSARAPCLAMGRWGGAWVGKGRGSARVIHCGLAFPLERLLPTTAPRGYSHFEEWFCSMGRGRFISPIPLHTSAPFLVQLLGLAAGCRICSTVQMSKVLLS